MLCFFHTHSNPAAQAAFAEKLLKMERDSSKGGLNLERQHIPAVSPHITPLAPLVLLKARYGGAQHKQN